MRENVQKFLILIVVQILVVGCDIGFLDFKSNPPSSGPGVGAGSVLGQAATAFQFSALLPGASSPTMELGVDCAAFKLVAVDAKQKPNQAPVAVPTRIELSMIGASEVRFYEDATQCQTLSTPITHIDLKAGESEKIFFANVREKSDYVIVGKSKLLGHQSSTNINVTRNYQYLNFLQRPLSVGGGLCSTAFKVQLQDGINAGFTVNNMRMKLGGAGQGSFYSDASCTVPVTFLDMVQSDTIEFYYKNNSIQGAMNISVTPVESSGRLSVLSQPTNVVRAVTQLEVLALASIAELGICHSYDVVMRDVENNEFAVSADTPLLLSAPSGNGTFHSTAGCNQSALSEITVPNGSSRQRVYFRPTSSGVLKIQAAPNLAKYNAYVLSQNVERHIHKMEFLSSSPTTAVGGLCQSTKFEVRLLDGVNAEINANSLVLDLAGISGVTKFYSNSTCSSEITTKKITLTNTSRGSFYFRNDTNASVNITLSAAPDSELYSTFASISRFISVQADAVAVGITASPTDIFELGLCSTVPFTVTSLDVEGNAYQRSDILQVSLASVRLNNQSILGDFYLDPNCNSKISQLALKNGSGQPASSAIFYFRPKDASYQPSANQWKITGVASIPSESRSISGEYISTQAIVRTHTNSQLTVPSVVGAGRCNQISFDIQDGLGTSYPLVATSSFSLSVSEGSFYSSAACDGGSINSVTITAGNSGGSFYYMSPNKANAVVLSITPPASLPRLESFGQTFDVVGVPSKITLSAPTDVNLQSCSETPFRLQVLDSDSASVPVHGGVLVSVSGPLKGSFYSNANCTGSSLGSAFTVTGATQDIYFRASAVAPSSGVFSFGAKDVLSSLTLTGVSSNTVTIHTSKLVSSWQGSGVVNLGDCEPFKVELQSDAGTPLSKHGGLDLSYANTIGTFHSNSNCTGAAPNLSNLSASANFYFKPTAKGNAVVQVSSADQTALIIVSATVPVVHYPTSLELVSSATVHITTCSSPFTAVLKDGNGAEFYVPSGEQASLNLTTIDANTKIYSDASCQTIFNAATLAAGQSRIVFYLRRDLVANGINIGLSLAALPTPSAWTQSGAMSVTFERGSLELDRTFMGGAGFGTASAVSGSAAISDAVHVPNAAGLSDDVFWTVGSDSSGIVLAKRDYYQTALVSTNVSLADVGAASKFTANALTVGSSIWAAGEMDSQFSFQRFDLSGNHNLSVALQLKDDFGGSYSGAAYSLVQSGSSFYLAGVASLSGRSYCAVAKVNSAGVLDTSFDSDGILVLEEQEWDAQKGTSNSSSNSPLGSYCEVRKILLHSSGDIILVGHSSGSLSSTADYDIALIRISSTGALVNAMGSDGVVLTDLRNNFTSGKNDFAADALIVDESGTEKIVVVGQSQASTNSMAITKFLLSNGNLDTGFGGELGERSGFDVLDGFNGSVGFSVVADPQGDFVVVGSYNNDFFAVRYNSAGVVQDTKQYTEPNWSQATANKAFLVDEDFDKVMLFGSADGQFSFMRILE